MTAFYEFIGVPFGFIISIFYGFSGNYLFSIFCLMLLVKLILLPPAISQQKSMAKQARLQPKLRRIKEKYAGNQQKIQEETSALYQKEGYSSMTGGCLPMLIQLPIMMGLYQVNYHPLSMVLRIPKDVVGGLKEAVLPLLGSAGSAATSSFRTELYALEHFNEIKGGVPGITEEIVSKVEVFMGKFNFFGLDLAHTPDFKVFDVYWIIPIISGIVALAMSLYSMQKQKQTNPDMAKNPSMGCMMLFTPLMQVYFGFLFPISVGMYIIMSSGMSFIQMAILGHTHSPKKVLARLMVEETIYRRSKEENTKKVGELKNEE
ncbi:MAG: YidC/Oxa1 family membrane protein insertase [Oscillospiraceae bacterium]